MAQKAIRVKPEQEWLDEYEVIIPSYTENLLLEYFRKRKVDTAALWALMSLDDGEEEFNG